MISVRVSPPLHAPEFAAISVTVYVPTAPYKCDGSTAVEFVPSPNVHVVDVTFEKVFTGVKGVPRHMESGIVKCADI